MTPEELSERLWDFAALIGKLLDALPDTRLGRHVAGQLVRCGTSAPPNYDEGCAGESRADFIHKLSIALKELRETRGWLRFTLKAELLSDSLVSHAIDESEQLCRILGKSLGTAKRSPGSSSAYVLRDEPILNSQFSILNLPLFHSLDHVAIVVADTDDALRFYQEVLGLPLLFTEVLEEQNVRLTHLDLGNTQLQLVQPLTPDHPLAEYLRQRGEGLHHLCFFVANVPQSMAALSAAGLNSRDQSPRRGPNGRQAAFIDPKTTRGVLFEMTADARMPDANEERSSTGS